uniref:Glutamate receptor n=1 Tax=Macrostomum lignano TaxID=282301 RepID=A0A1I8H5L6_9PLAT
MLTMIRNYCPRAPRIHQTAFNTSGAFSIDSLPTTNELSSVKASLSEWNFLFFGIKQNSVTQVLEAVTVPTTLSEFPVMQKHVVAPLPQSLLMDALLKAIAHRINESQHPAHPSNYKAALLFDNSVQISELYPLFTYFTEGVIYYPLNVSLIEADLLSVRRSHAVNIILIVTDAQLGAYIRDKAFAIGLLGSRYRWFVHGPRFINNGWTIRSMNVTSLEFGRIDDAITAKVLSTTGAFIHDLLAIWTPYLKQYMCEEKNPVNRTVNGFTGSFKLNPDGSARRLTWQIEIYAGMGYHRVQFLVATLLSPPYVQYAEGASGCSQCRGSDLTGMYIEICKTVLNNLGITNYEFVLQGDAAYGIKTGDVWNGVIGTVMDGKAMLGCAPITINTNRFKAVDFTQVIHSSRESLLLRKRSTDPLMQVFQFILPLHYSIWLSILGVLILVALVLFVMNKIAPNSDSNYNFYNSVFFTFAEVVQGTAGTTPSQISSRIVVSFFWFFTMFLFLSYVANYAVFRTLDGVRQHVTSMETLIQNREYECGSLNNTVTDSLLQSSAYLHMQQVYLLMSETFTNGSVSDIGAALSLVNDRTKNFVLISDSLQNKYYSEIGCDLVSTGDFYDLKNAMILPKDTEYKHLFDAQLANMTQEIASLQTKFFTVHQSAKNSCYDGSFDSVVRYYIPKDAWPIEPGALTLADTLGIAVINLVGCCVAVALAGMERLIGHIQRRRSGIRREQQVVKASEVKFRRPSV